MTDLNTFLHAWTEAERTGDAEASNRLLTDNFVGIGPLGFVLPKAAWLGRLSGGGLQYEQLSLDEQSARVYGRCAVTTARWNAKGTAQGRPIPEAARATLISVEQDHGWRLAGIHYSFIAGTPGAPALGG